MLSWHLAISWELSIYIYDEVKYTFKIKWMYLLYTKDFVSFLMVWMYKGIFLKHAYTNKTYKYSSLSDICYNFLTVTVGKSGKGADFLPEATLARANQALTRGSHQFPTPSYRFNKYIQSQCNNTLPSGGMYWKIRPPRIKRFAEARILHPEAREILLGKASLTWLLRNT